MRVRLLVLIMAMALVAMIPAGNAIAGSGSIDDFRIVSSSCSVGKLEFVVEYTVTVDAGPPNHYVASRNSAGGAGSALLPPGTSIAGSGTTTGPWAPGKLVTIDVWIQDTAGPPGAGTVYDHETVVFNCSDGKIVQKVPSCAGKPATVIGTAGDDTLWGIDAGHLNLDPDDVIVALGGNDKIYSRGGNDTVCAGSGDDVIVGGPGDDVLFAASGNDNVSGGSGNDTITGGHGNDLLRGSDGDDVVRGGGGDDTLRGGLGNDDLTGNSGVDGAEGNAGFDTCVAEMVSGCEA